MKFPVRCAVAVLSLGVWASAAPAAPVAWDQEKVTGLAQQLETSVDALSEALRTKPRPNLAQGQSRSFWRLGQSVRQLRRDARWLSRALQRGAGHDETLPTFESMMQTVRTARDDARRVFVGTDVVERAGEAREILNQLAPFYDAEATPLEPVTR